MNLALGALVSGVLLGVAARFTMRLVALVSGVPVSFSVGGSIEVIVLGALLGTPLALGYLLLRRRTHRTHAWHGLGFGLAAFGMFALFPMPSAESALASTPDSPAVTAVAFALLLGLWGIGLELLGRRLDRGRLSA